MKNSRKFSQRQKIIIMAYGFAIICFLYLLLLLNGVSYMNTSTYTPKARLTIISNSNIPTVDMNLILSRTATLEVKNNILENEFSIGAYVQITGTGGVGLRIRENPGTGSETIFLANESEVFKIIGGPINNDQFNWWQLQAPYDKNRQGWAAADYINELKQ
ncbi:MAG: SH3 domain-containing protein [Chloroflexi bacterium]|nr:SH3 domain-containing protein [Chloroflexota bacterium]